MSRGRSRFEWLLTGICRTASVRTQLGQFAAHGPPGHTHTPTIPTPHPTDSVWPCQTIDFFGGFSPPLDASLSRHRHLRTSPKSQLVRYVRLIVYDSGPVWAGRCLRRRQERAIQGGASDEQCLQSPLFLARSPRPGTVRCGVTTRPADALDTLLSFSNGRQNPPRRIAEGTLPAHGRTRLTSSLVAGQIPHFHSDLRISTPTIPPKWSALRFSTMPSTPSTTPRRLASARS